MVKGILRDWLGVTELQESQQIDAEQFQRLFGALKEWQEAQKIDAKQFEEVFSALKKWQEAQGIDAEKFEKVFSALEEKIGTEQFQNMQEYLNGLQEKFTDLEEKVETLAETVGGQDQAMMICCIVASVAALAAISFIGFCIYQGVKCEREKEKNLSSTPDTKLDIDGGVKLNNLMINKKAA